MSKFLGSIMEELLVFFKEKIANCNYKVRNCFGNNVVYRSNVKKENIFCSTLD